MSLYSLSSPGRRRPSPRSVSLVAFAENFPPTDFLDYALATEDVTSAKQDTLILNVDGALLRSPSWCVR